MPKTFPLTINLEAAWYIRNIVRPGIEVEWPLDSPQAKADAVARSLRRKINTIILRMLDEGTSSVEMDCTEDEGWIIDANISYDGGGAGTALLIQLFRGFWYLDIGQHITNTPDIVDDPRAGWSNTKLKEL